MNNQNLIPVFSGSLSDSETLLCDTRKLHEFLQVNSKFADWIKNRISEYGFVENQDFLVSKILETKNATNRAKPPAATSLNARKSCTKHKGCLKNAKPRAFPPKSDASAAGMICRSHGANPTAI